MKKTFYTLFSVLLFASLSTAQSLVSKSEENKVVILEEFTGIKCGYCPDGHRIANNMKAADPDNVVIINVHAGGYATPSAGQPDFRTPFGDNLAREMGVLGYPSGTVNRKTFDDGLALSRAVWQVYGDEIKEEKSPVNVGVESSFDETTRELTVNVELYYTGNTSASNFVHVAFLQNGVVGYQVDYSNGNSNNYEHNKILRHFLTGQWGDEVSSPEAGGEYSKSYTWTVPQDYDIEDCDIVAYVSESRRNIFTGKKVKANGGSTVVVSSLSAAPGANYISTDAGEDANVDMELSNFLPDADTYDISLSLDAPDSWSAQVLVDGNAASSVDVDGNTDMNIGLKVNSGSEVGIGVATLTMQSKAFPQSKPLTYQVNVISGVTDLVISNAEAERYEVNYMSALEEADNRGFYNTKPQTLVGFQENNALAGVNNVYYNIGWTFPGLTEDMVASLSTFLDRGGNLFVAGQDIGWDTWESAGNGTPVTQAFYEDYLHADYLSDGSSSNGSIRPVDGDNVFGGVGTSTIRDIYGGGNIYPEELSPINGAEAIFNYGSGSKVGGVRYTDGNYKVVYLGFNLEQLSDRDVALRILRRAHNWFYGLSTDVNEIPEFSSTVFPNPTSDLFTMSLEQSVAERATLSIYNMQGQLVHTDYMTKGQQKIQVQATGLEAGLYMIELRGQSQQLLGKSRISVIR